MGVTETVASFIASSRYENLSTNLVAAAKVGILDGVANMLAGQVELKLIVARFQHNRSLGLQPAAFPHATIEINEQAVLRKV